MEHLEEPVNATFRETNLVRGLDVVLSIPH
jgi:hypothetical protein